MKKNIWVYFGSACCIRVASWLVLFPLALLLSQLLPETTSFVFSLILLSLQSLESFELNTLGHLEFTEFF